MSGIAGIVYPDAFQVNHLIIPMMKALAHRGLTSQHVTTRNIEVGVCGAALASSPVGFVGLDGWLHNRKSLREQLNANGYVPAGDQDADLVMSAYDLWGESFLEHIFGDFALFLLDQRKERLILARDRIGKKPLYWYHDQNTFIFSSELKSILMSGAVPQTPNPEALGTYLYFGYIPQDISPIKGVNKLLPGYYLQLNRNQYKTIQSYWSYSSCFADKLNLDQKEIVEHLDHLLLNSVKNCIPEDKSVGCLLSGGLGSASVAHYTRQINPSGTISAYTVGFEKESDSDIKATKETADKLNFNYHYELITPQTLFK